MSDINWQQLTRTPRRWAQFLGWFLGIELFANVLLISTIAGLGWDSEVRTHRVIIQLVVLAVAIIFGLYQAFSRSIAGWIGGRIRIFGGVVQRNEQVLAHVERLERLLAGSQAEAARNAAAQREAEREAEQARGAAEAAPIQRLAETLRAIIVTEQIERNAAQLHRCHRTTRGELVCTLPLGRVHGMVEGITLTVVDERERRPIGQFRITGTADNFAAVTLIEGDGWLRSAEQFQDAALPPHTLSVPLPDAARGIDGQTADQMLRLLSTIATNGYPPGQRVSATAQREVRR